MDTCICDISALRFWDTPPLVTAIMGSGPEDARALGFSSAEQMETVRRSVLEESRLYALCSKDGRRWNAASNHSLNLREVAPLLAAGLEPPVHVLARTQSERHSSELVTPALWTSEIPPGAFVQITESVRIATPEFALLQLAKRLGLNKCLFIASGLCGTYAEYRAPRALERHLAHATQEGSWRPYLIGGKLQTLRQREPLATPDSIRRMATLASHARGAGKLARVSELVFPGAASPFESKAGLILGLPTGLGGYGHEGMVHNKQVLLQMGSQRLSEKRCCYCDLYWEEGVDVECQSRMAHENEVSFLSDSERATALLNEGITVLPLTYTQLSDRSRLDEFAQVLAKLRGIAPKSRNDRQLQKADTLFNDLLRPF